MFLFTGLRLGKIIAKIGLVQLLRSFDFGPIRRGDIEFENYSIFLLPKGGVDIRVTERLHK